MNLITESFFPGDCPSAACSRGTVWLWAQSPRWPPPPTPFHHWRFRSEARGQPSFVHNLFPLRLITAGEMHPDWLALGKQPIWLGWNDVAGRDLIGRIKRQKKSIHPWAWRDMSMLAASLFGVLQTRKTCWVRTEVLLAHPASPLCPACPEPLSFTCRPRFLQDWRVWYPHLVVNSRQRWQERPSSGPCVLGTRLYRMLAPSDWLCWCTSAQIS